MWNDIDMAIAWPILDQALIVSAKDKVGKLLVDAEVFA